MTIDEMNDAERVVRHVFAIMGDEERIRTVDLLPALRSLPYGPWRKIYGHGLDEQDLARLLRLFWIAPKHMRFSDRRGSIVARGYERGPIRRAISELEQASSELDTVLVQFLRTREPSRATGRFWTPEGYQTVVGVTMRGRGRFVNIECDIFRTRFEWTEAFQELLKSRVEQYIVDAMPEQTWWMISSEIFSFKVTASDTAEWKQWIAAMLSDRSNYAYRKLWATRPKQIA